MPDNGLNVDPNLLRQRAQQHRDAADQMREWGKIPTDWLDQFPTTYGKIATPVHAALHRYYNARNAAAMQGGQTHDNLADHLDGAAAKFERIDAESGINITKAMQPGGSTPNGNSTGPVGAHPIGSAPTGAGPATQGAAPGAGPAGGSGGPGGDGGSQDTSPGGSAAMAPGAMTPGAVVPPAAFVPPGTGPTAAGQRGSSGTGSEDAAAAAAETVAAEDAQALGGVFAPAATPVPLAAAVAAETEKAAEPGYMVGEAVDEDLMLARTVLAGILAATDEVVGVDWAVSVMRNVAGVEVYATSNEGRGWLPAGLYLPQEVALPWGQLDDGSESAWEGVADPDRILVEFARAWSARTGARLTALVASDAIGPGVRAACGEEVAVQGEVPPSDTLNLSEPGPDRLDRLQLMGSEKQRALVTAAPESGRKQQSAEWAWAAHTRVVKAGIGAVDGLVRGLGVRELRQRILTRLWESNAEIPADWYDELRAADNLLAAAVVSRRLDADRVGVGELREDAGTAVLRGLTFERRCDEMVLLTAAEPSVQALRDIGFAYGAVVDHPNFPAAPVAASAPTTVTAPAAQTGAQAPVGGVVGPVASGPGAAPSESGSVPPEPA